MNVSGGELSEAAIRDLAGGYHPTLGDAERCLENAARHLSDAAVCSPQSRLMHTELALEEVAKGFLVHWRLDIQRVLGAPERAVERFRALRPEVRELLTEHHRVLGAKAFEESFARHSVKIGHLRFLAKSFGKELRGGNFVSWRPAKPYSDATVRVLAELGEVSDVAQKGRTELLRLVEVLTHLSDPDDPNDSLTRLRERATYVDRSDDATTSPVADAIVSVRLSDAAAFLASTLSMANVIHRDHHPDSP